MMGLNNELVKVLIIVFIPPESFRNIRPVVRKNKYKNP